MMMHTAPAFNWSFESMNMNTKEIFIWRWCDDDIIWIYDGVHSNVCRVHGCHSRPIREMRYIIMNWFCCISHASNVNVCVLDWFYLAVICLPLYFYYIIVLIVRDSRMTFIVLSAWFVVSFCIFYTYIRSCHFALLSIYLSIGYTRRFHSRIHTHTHSCVAQLTVTPLTSFARKIRIIRNWFLAVCRISRLSAVKLYAKTAQRTCNEFMIMIKW